MKSLLGMVDLQARSLIQKIPADERWKFFDHDKALGELGMKHDAMAAALGERPAYSQIVEVNNITELKKDFGDNYLGVLATFHNDLVDKVKAVQDELGAMMRQFKARYAAR